MFYTRFFNVKLPADDLNKIETCRSVNGLRVKVYLQYPACAFVGLKH